MLGFCLLAIQFWLLSLQKIVVLIEYDKSVVICLSICYLLLLDGYIVTCYFLMDMFFICAYIGPMFLIKTVKNNSFIQ